MAMIRRKTVKTWCIFVLVFTAWHFGGAETSAQSVRDFVQRALSSVVLLTTYDIDDKPIAQATGFFIPDGTLITNYHVVAGVKSVVAKVIGSAKTFQVAGALALDEDADLAALAVVDWKGPGLRLGDDGTASVGDKIYVIANPRGLEGSVSEGIVSAFRRLGAHQLLQITAPISAGSSGGPVLDGQGKVIGVATATLRDGQNLNFATSVSAVRALLAKRRGLEGFPSRQTPEARATDTSDVLGWQTTRWGMSEVDVRQTLKLEGETLPLKEASPRHTGFRFQTTIDGVDCMVELWFASDHGGLQRVMISPTADGANGEGARVLAAGTVLRRLLVEKYGPPHSVEETPWSEIRWRFPTTIIRFVQIDFGAVGSKWYAGVGVTYEPTALAEKRRRRERDKL